MRNSRNYSVKSYIFYGYIYGVVWEFQNYALWIHFNMPDYPLTGISVFPWVSADCECEEDLVSILVVVLAYCIDI